MEPMMMRRADARELLERRCAEKGVLAEALQAGSRSREYSSIRRELAGKFVIEMCLSHADAARMQGILTYLICSVDLIFVGIFFTC
jgi:hypothetical protein